MIRKVITKRNEIKKRMMRKIAICMATIGIVGCLTGSMRAEEKLPQEVINPIYIIGNSEVDMTISEKGLLESDYMVPTDYYLVTASKLNVRKEPNIKGEILGSYLNNSLVKVIEKSGIWYKTDKGYVHSDYLKMQTKYEMNKINKEPKAAATPVSRGGFIERAAIIKSLNINERTNISPSDLGRLLSGSGLEGLEQAFYDIEQNHGVNSIFAIAVARLESGNGNSGLARQKNNIFGFNTSRGFSSKADCVYYFGDYINRKYFNRGITTPSGIQPIYCPPNKSWDEHVMRIMQRDLNRL